MVTEHLPLVTIAIPTFNRRDLLKRAVTSALKQTYSHLEIVISDNGSQDGTQEYLKSLNDTRVRILLGEGNVGMVSNWNRCLEKAHGTYFLLLSDDDAFIRNDAIEKLVREFLGGSADDVGMVFSAVMLEQTRYGYTEKTTYAVTTCRAEGIIADFFTNKVSVFPCTTLLKTNDIRSLGGYRGFNASMAVDACVWISLVMQYGSAKYIDQPLALYRVHESLSASSIDVMKNDFYEMRQIIEANKFRFSEMTYRRIQTGMDSMLGKVPIAYIVRQWRYNTHYGLRSVLFDILKYRKMLFRYSNLVFIFNRLVGKLVRP